MLKTYLDHIVIGAETIRQGVDYIQEEFGVDVPEGGEHPRMGTHNHLMKLGENLFFEIIAIDPEASVPKRPRWFDLDNPYIQAQLRTKPRLLTWVINTPDIKSLLKGNSFSFGLLEPMSRGALKWLVTIPEDGRLLGAGLIPTIIQWQEDFHPAAQMPDLGCSLLSLEIFHPYYNWLKFILSGINAADHVQINPLAENSSPYLLTRFQTPQGEKELMSIV